MSQYAPVLDLATLDGVNGFRIDGPAISAQSGSSLAYAGDLNGDGFDDLIIGASRVGGLSGEGSAYVLFGSATSPGQLINLAVLNGSNGFEISAPTADEFGYSVSSAGDVNGDGLDDMIVGGIGAKDSYVVFGTTAGFAANVPLSSIDGSNGFRIDGGFSVSAVGDVNGDGVDDVAVADPKYAGITNDAFVGVIYGHAADTAWGASVDATSLDGTDGFIVTDSMYAVTSNFLGAGIAGIGDFNGDGIDDFAVTAPGEARTHTNGAAYILFGEAGGPPATSDVGSYAYEHGEALIGDSGGQVGYRVSAAGDLNGDGLADVIFAGGGGASYVLLGNETGGAINASEVKGSGIGFVVASSGGRAVSGAGDVNGDGFDDLVVADYGGSDEKGAAYVVFGRANLGDLVNNLDTISLDGNDGFRIEGDVAGDDAGWSVTIGGDLNGDGLADIIIGAPKGDNEGLTDSGTTYVVYGVLPGEAVTRVGSAIGQTIHGSNFADLLSGLGGNDHLIGHNGDDTLDGGAGDDTIDGGAGKDTVTYASATAGVTVDLRVGGAQDTGGAGIDTLVAVDALIGSGFADRLTGDTDASSLAGRCGNDTLIGGGGGDTLDGGAGADDINGRGGRDLVTYAGATSGVAVDLSGLTASGGDAAGDMLHAVEDLLGSSYADTLTGDARQNHLQGSNGDDVLNGGANGDLLEGGSGKDTLTGGAGQDTMTGGIGVDAFAFTALADSRLAAPDTITDLANVDRIDLSAIDANKHLAGDQAFHLVAAFTHHAGELVLAYDSGSGRTSLSGDINGDGAADFLVWIDGDRHQFSNFML